MKNLSARSKIRPAGTKGATSGTPESYAGRIAAPSGQPAQPSGLFCYPDVVVVRGELQFWGAEKDTVTNPLLLVEVLSPSTEGWDRGGKFARYRMLESLREVVFVSQDRVLVEQFTRQDDGRWMSWRSRRSFDRPGAAAGASGCRRGARGGGGVPRGRLPLDVERDPPRERHASPASG